jgi:hypothetical protein
MRSTGHVEQMGDIKSIKILIEKSKGKRLFRDLDVGNKIILNVS